MAESTQPETPAAARSAVAQAVADPVSRRRFIALSGGSAAAAAFLAACGEDSGTTRAFDPTLDEAQVLKAVEPFIA